MTTAAPKKLTREQVTRALLTDPKYAGVRWIVNVLMTGCGKPASRLAALKALVDSGREIGVASFKMPYEALTIDGRVVLGLPLLDRGEEIPYNEANVLAELRRR